jgi:uncharacterized protein (DUF58 family)
MKSWRDTLFPTFKAIDRFVRQSLTTGGKAILLVMLLSLFGLIYLETPLIYLLSSLLAIMIVAGIVSFILRPQLLCRVLTPDTVMTGQAASMEVYLENPRFLSRYDLLLEAIRIPAQFQIDPDDLPLVNEVKSKRSARALMPFRIARRGICRWPRLQVSSSFPFNLFRFRQTFRVQGELIALPRFLPLAGFSFADTCHQLAGSFDHSANQVDDSEMLLGSREFVPGMTVKRWDYASWARIGKPAVREYQSERQQTASLLIDTFAAEKMDEDFESRFEAVLSLTASLSQRLSEIEFDLENVLLGSDDLNLDRDLSRSVRLQMLNRELALAQPDAVAHLDAIVNHHQPLLADASVLFVILNGWDDRRAALLQRLDTQRQYTRVMMVTGRAYAKPDHAPRHIVEVTVDQINLGAVEV